MSWKDFVSLLNTLSAFVLFAAAVYMARFKYKLVEELKKQFYPLALEALDYPFTRRQAAGIEKDIADIKHVDEDQWTEINRIRAACEARMHRRPQ